MGYAQNISELVLSVSDVHNPCALNNRSAQINRIFVRYTKIMHKHCAFKSVFAQNLNVFGPLREIKTICS